MSILDSCVMQRRKKDVEDVIYNTGNISLYELKLSFAINRTKPIELERKKLTNSFSIEILDVSVHQELTYVVNPECRIQKTKNGGTVSLICLEKDIGSKTCNIKHILTTKMERSVQRERIRHES